MLRLNSHVSHEICMSLLTRMYLRSLLVFARLVILFCIVLSAAAVVTAAVAAGVAANVFERSGHCRFFAATRRPATVSKHILAVGSLDMFVCWSTRTLSGINSRKQRTSTSVPNKGQFESAAPIADRAAAVNVLGSFDTAFSQSVEPCNSS